MSINDNFYITAPLLNMLEKPDINSKVVSQALFSEHLIRIEQCGGWSLITTPDNYSGWVENRCLIQLKMPFLSKLTVSRLAAHVYREADVEYGPLFTLPFGSKLLLKENLDKRWAKVTFPDGNAYFIQHGDIVQNLAFMKKKDLPEFSLRFLGLPYTWGGRSSFGYDCSGFVQMLYCQIGILLPRDSKQQAQDQRFQMIPLQDLEPGDLIFFGKSEEKIAHVALSLSNNEFIHASTREGQPWIRTSHFSDFEWSGHKDAYYPYRMGKRWNENNV